MLTDWLENRKKPLAIVCDIDDTICRAFDQAIESACNVLCKLDSDIEVFYVTSRPDEARSFTEEFLEKHHLPGLKNLRFCPQWKSSRIHKAEITKELAREYDLIFCIGDADEDEQAALEADVSFIRIAKGAEEDAWKQAVALITDRMALRRI